MLGERIAYYRKKRGLTQKAVAEKVEISNAFMSFIESGKNKPSIENLNKIADVLNVSVDALTKEDEQVINPITGLVDRLVELTEVDSMKWQREYLEDIRQDSETYFGYKHKIGKLEFLNQGVDENEQLEDLYFMGGLNKDTYYLTKVKDKEKYNLYGFHADLLDHESDLVYLGSSEDYSEITKLYLSAKLNAEGKTSVYGFLNRAESYEKIDNI